jgi:hypothetical protein
MITFKHSGNAGDIIFSIPAINAVMENNMIGGIVGEAEIQIRLGVAMGVSDPVKHPTGGVQMNATMFDMIKPLLLSSGYIKSVRTWTGDQVDYDLDRFRAQPIQLGMGNISRWYSNIVNLPINLHESWISVLGLSTDIIIVARSERYLNPNLDYSFLEGHNIMFIGIDKEFELIKKQIPNAIHQKVDNFLEMAQLIDGCKMFIGNQSLPYAIAEGLKVDRILEPCLYAGNVIPCGGKCIEAYTQKTFEEFFKYLL